MPVAKAKEIATALRKKRGMDVKQATRIAMHYLFELMPALRNQNVMLEEVEQSDDGRYWLITLGYDSVSRAAVVLGLRGQAREYKTFKVDANTGEVLSMKIRAID